MVGSVMVLQNVQPMVGFEENKLEQTQKNICDKMRLDDYFDYCGDELSVRVLDIDGVHWDHRASVASEIATFQNQRVQYELLVHDVLYGNVDVNQRVDSGYTALHLAVCYNHHGVIEQLLRLGASPHLRNLDGHQPLFYALQSGCPGCVELLAAHNADVDQAVYGSCYLHFAVDKNCTEIAEILLRYNANPNQCDDLKNTPLHVASRYGHLEMVRLLLQNGADQLLENLDRKTALSIALDYGRKEVFALLAAHEAKLYLHDAVLLYKSIASGDPDFFAILVNSGAQVNGTSRHGRTALHMAVINCNSSALKLLLSHGADVNCRDNSGKTPLHFAIDLRKPELFEELLRHGADVNARDNQRRTPLHLAVKQNCVSSVHLLLEHGADVNAQDTDKRSPLHLVNNSNVRIFDALSSSGCLDVSAADVEGRTPLHLAVDSEHRKLIYLNPEHTLVARLVSNGADVNSRTVRTGETPLHLAAKNGCGVFAAILMDHGADANIPETTLGRTPLHLAVEVDAPECVSYLLRFGANIDLRDVTGRTPLELASTHNNIMTMVQHLVKMRVAGFKVDLHVRLDHHFEEACAEELSRMLSSKIYSDVTFYEFMRATRRRLSELVQISEVTKAFASDALRSQFPLYVDILEMKYITGKRYESLLQPAAVSLSLALPTLLPEIQDKILGYLNDIDMKNLIMAL